MDFYLFRTFWQKEENILLKAASFGASLPDPLCKGLDSFEHLIRTSSAMKARLVFGRISTTDHEENYLYLPRYWHEIRRYVLKENN